VQAWISSREVLLSGLQAPQKHTVAVELCCETAVQDLNPWWGSTCRTRPKHVLEIAKELFFAILRTTFGRIVRPILEKGSVTLLCQAG